MNRHKTEYPIITTDIGTRGDTGIKSLSFVTIILFLLILAIGVYIGSYIYEKTVVPKQTTTVISDNTNTSYITPEYDAVMSVTEEHNSLFFKNTTDNENILYIYNVYNHETGEKLLEDATVAAGYAYEWDIYNSDIWTDTFIVLDVHIAVIDKTNETMIGVDENIPVQTITVKRITK